MKRVLAAIFLSCFIMTSSGCFGSFSLTNKLYSWNDTVGDKFVNSLVFWVLVILPVYNISVLADVILFNLIEFWTGNNPIALENGETFHKTLVKNGRTWDMTASRDGITVIQTKGPEAGQKLELICDRANKTWFMRDENGLKRIASTDENGNATLYMPDGNTVDMCLAK